MNRLVVEILIQPVGIHTDSCHRRLVVVIIIITDIVAFVASRSSIFVLARAVIMSCEVVMVVVVFVVVPIVRDEVVIDLRARIDGGTRGSAEAITSGIDVVVVRVVGGSSVVVGVRGLRTRRLGHGGGGGVCVGVGVLPVFRLCSHSYSTCIHVLVIIMLIIMMFIY